MQENGPTLLPNVEDLFNPLEEVIRKQFLPSITGHNAFGDKKRDLLALSTRLGGLGIADPFKQVLPQCTACMNITAPLVELIVNQSEVYGPETKTTQTRAKNRTCTFHRQQQARDAAELKAGSRGTSKGY